VFSEREDTKKTLYTSLPTTLQISINHRTPYKQLMISANSSEEITLRQYSYLSEPESGPITNGDCEETSFVIRTVTVIPAPTALVSCNCPAHMEYRSPAENLKLPPSMIFIFSFLLIRIELSPK
jgi:hypothetical protein